jgi:glycosyltransferase involved in cell wall biosynthesis
MMDAYRRHGIPVTVAPWLPLWRAQPTIRETLAQLARALTATWKARANLRALSRRVNEEFDVVHLNYESLFPVAAWLRTCTRKPLVQHCRARLRRTPWGRLHARLISRLASTFVFITENERAHFLSLGGKDGTVIHNPKPMTTPDMPPPPILPNDGRLRVGCFSNYSHDRGVDRAVEIATALKRAGRTDIVFVMAGDMTLHRSDPGLLGEIAKRNGTLADYARASDVSDMFIFTGHVSRPEALMRGCDVIVKLSRFDEPWGRDVIEAMSLGKPVLATGTWQGFIENGRCGFLIAPFSPGTFSEKLALLADQRELVERMGGRARSRIDALCDPAARADDLVAVWRSAAGAVREFSNMPTPSRQ